MINIVKKKINMSDELKAKINWSCKFNKKSYRIIEGTLRIVEHTNLAYVEPHKVIIEDTAFLKKTVTNLNNIILSIKEYYLLPEKIDKDNAE